MNQIQHNLLMFIEHRYINVQEYIPFNKIIAELLPIYKQNNILLDQSQIYQALSRIVDEGYLEATNNNYRLTLRGLIYAKAYPILQVEAARLNQRYQSRINYLSFFVILSVFFSLWALVAK
jgi:hypothetical protein